MTRILVVFVALCSVAMLADSPTPDLSGTWTLDKTISVDPSKITLMPTAGANGNQSHRGGGRHGGFGGYGGGGRNYSGSSNHDTSNGGATSLSLVEQQRLKVVTDELRTASASLVISQQDSKVVVQDALKRSQSFPTDGSKTTNNVADNVIESTTRWTNGHLVTECPVSDRLTLVYTYTLLPATNQLVLRVNRKDGDNLRPFDPDVKFVYVRAKS